MLNLPLSCYKINHFFSPIHHGLLIPTHLPGIWHFILLQNKQTLLFQSVGCFCSLWLLPLHRSSLTAPCPAQNPAPSSSQGPDSTKQSSRIISHLLQPPLPWQHSTFSVPTTTMPRSFLLIFSSSFPFWLLPSIAAAQEWHFAFILPALLFPDDFIQFQVHFAFQPCFPVYQICRF